MDDFRLSEHFDRLLLTGLIILFSVGVVIAWRLGATQSVVDLFRDGVAGASGALYITITGSRKSTPPAAPAVPVPAGGGGA